VTWLDEMLTHLGDQRELLRALLAEHLPLVKLVQPQASYLAWLDCRALNLDRDPAAFFMDRARVGLNSGPTFGPTGQGFARLNFATSPEILAQVIERMAAAVR
jgi:cysteine-S-conjugate beta-lyase